MPPAHRNVLDQPDVNPTYAATAWSTTAVVWSFKNYLRDHRDADTRNS
jgi:hypothetical protein